MEHKCPSCGSPWEECPMCVPGGIHGFRAVGPGRIIGAFWNAPAQDESGNAFELAIILPEFVSGSVTRLENLERARKKNYDYIQKIINCGSTTRGLVWVALEALPSNNLVDLVSARTKLSSAATSYVALITLEVIEILVKEKTPAGTILPEDITISPSRLIKLREPNAGYASDDYPTAYRAPESGKTTATDLYSLGRLIAFMLTGSPQTLPDKGDGTQYSSLLKLLCAIDPDDRPDDLATLRQVFLHINRGEPINELVAQLSEKALARHAVHVESPSLESEPVVPLQGEPIPDVTPREIPTPVTPPPVSVYLPEVEDTPTPQVTTPKQELPPPPPPAPKPLIVTTTPQTPPVEVVPLDSKPRRREKTRQPETTDAQPDQRTYKEKLLKWSAVYVAILINALILLVFFILILRKVI